MVRIDKPGPFRIPACTYLHDVSFSIFNPKVHSHQEQESAFDHSFFGEILSSWGTFTHLSQTSSWISRFRHVEDDTNHC
jgi:hypothetical protein